DRNIGAVGDSCLNRPLIVDFCSSEDSLLTIRIETVEDRVAGHEIVRRELGFDVRLGNDATNANVHPLKNVRNVKIEIHHRHVEAGVTVVLLELVAEPAAGNRATKVETQ